MATSSPTRLFVTRIYSLLISNCRVYDLFLVYCIYKGAVFADARITPEYISLPSPYLYSFARFAVWALYGFANGLVGTGLWVLAHECGHQAFSESKTLNNTVGWILHSAYAHSLRCSGAQNAY